MLILEMTKTECHRALSRMNFGRLACAQGNQPYVVPFYFAYDENYLYSLATLGKKIEWMRKNPLICVEVDDVKSHNQWESVIVFGRYEEIADSPQQQSLRQYAHDLLQQRAMWWQPAYVASTYHGHPHSLTPVYYRILIRSMSGRRAAPDLTEALAMRTTRHVKARDWLHHLLHPAHSKD